MQHCHINSINYFFRKCTQSCPGNPKLACGGDIYLSIYGPIPNQGVAYGVNGVSTICKPWCKTMTESKNNVMKNCR